MASFQYVSDLHLEMTDSAPAVPRCAPNIIVAGDVCSPFDDKYARFISDLSTRFDRVFLLTGNHCYYAAGDTDLMGVKWMRHVDDTVRATCAAMPKGNVHFLQNDAHDIEGTDLTVFGTTLWSDVSREEERDVRMMIADYRCIPGFAVDAGRTLHAQAKAALSEELARPGRRYVVATHHLPSMSLIDPKYRGSPMNSAFASDVPLADDPRIVAWFYGHTHTPHDDDRFHCNPVGYPGENTVVRLDKVVDL